MNTSNILFICGGAFAGIEKILANKGRGTTIGFGADVKEPNAQGVGELLGKLEPEDLLKFGLIPEFVGRLPVFATLEDLDEAALVSILTEPKNALVKQYQRLFDMEGVKLEFTEDALTAVAKKAIIRKTGARGLRSILENMLMDTMYEVPDKEDVEKVIVSKETVDDNKPPVYVIADGKKKKKEPEVVEA